jgi:DNA-binding CsgD family transcriptional regulator
MDGCLLGGRSAAIDPRVVRDEIGIVVAVEVLVRLGQGRPTPEIAAELHVSRKTVFSHLEHIYAKLGVKTRTGAALFAMRHGLTGAAGAPRA